MNNFMTRGVIRDADPGAVGGGAAPIETPNPQPQAPSFDPTAFETSLTGKFQGMLNAAMKGIEKKLQPPAPVTPPPNSDSDAPVDLSKLTPEQQAAYQRQERRIKALEEDARKKEDRATAAEKAATEKERTSQIRDVLRGIEFKDDAARAAAFKMAQGDITWSEDGNLIADTPTGPVMMRDYLKDMFESASLAGLLAPRGGGGAGAQKPGLNRGGFNPANWDNLDNLAKLTPEQQQAVRAHVLSLAK